MSDALLEQAIRSHPFTRGLRPDHVARLQKAAQMVQYSSGDKVFETGDPADRFYLIRSGVIELAVASNNPPRAVQTLSEGTVLGWSWAFDRQKWQFDAKAITPIRAIEVDGAALLKECELDHEFGYLLMRRLAEVMADRLHAVRKEVRT
ncbi:MAG: Crp/Fnr family transcriptional regulator [Acidimicrobiia bacterium]|nr:Crp/Fnr family transcriptional regulator [Acidimicrobiia bacterium]NNF65665.1 Crp/Fnr family transcriptional regulator [Acidimicrobiia bacterium]